MKAILLLIFLFWVAQAFGQQKYWVFYTDKQGSSFDPYSYFDQKAIDRRLALGIDLYDLSDYPVSTEYQQKVESIVDSVCQSSRWFNATAVVATNEQIRIVQQLSFVREIHPIYTHPFIAAVSETESTTDFDLLRDQTASMGGALFQDAGINGKGVRIAIFDGGFPGVDTMKTFEHIRNDNRIISTWDFTKNREFVYAYSSHGTTVMSCIGGFAGDIPIGLATGAEFLLARTEVNSEPFSEEENWVAALEWADKNGASIVNSSLGYTSDRYFPFQMDGQYSLVSRAASKASSKGILVVNAAGNEGNIDWHIIGAPADADSILSIGGIDPYSGLRINFSSYGPTVDGRLKPNVSAYGQVFAQGKKRMEVAYGTSFASPLVAGFAACALQIKTGTSAWDLLKMIEQSGNLYPYFDYSHGYGVPQASFFLESGSDTSHLSICPEVVVENDSLLIKIEGYNQLSEEESNQTYVYWHVRSQSGMIRQYYVATVFQSDVIHLPINEFEAGDVLMIHFNRCTIEYFL